MMTIVDVNQIGYSRLYDIVMTSSFTSLSLIMMNIITKENKALGEFLQSSLRLNAEHVEIYRRMIGEYAGHYEDQDTCRCILEDIDKQFAKIIEGDDGEDGMLHGDKWSQRIFGHLMRFNFFYYRSSKRMKIIYIQTNDNIYKYHDVHEVITALTNVEERRNGIWKGIMLVYNNVLCRSCGVLVDTKDDICSECAKTLCKKACEHCLSRRGKVICKKRRGQPSMWIHSICKKRRLE